MADKWVAKETISIETDYDIGKQLGEPGQFGVAKLCTRKSDGKEFAVKIIDKSKFVHSEDREKVFEDMRAEIVVMRSLDHENIVKLYQVYETKLSLYLVQELCSGGELFDMISKLGRYTEKDAADVLIQILRGLAHMHEKGIAHCDLKPDNFLFHESGKLKIIDFGMSKRIPHSKRHLTDLCGTPYYTAPEVLEGKYHSSADCWSVGVVMFVMLFGYPPFYADPEKYRERENEVIYKKIRKGFHPKVRKGYGRHFPQALASSDEARDLMKMLIMSDVADRMTAVEALDHKWFQNASSEQSISAQVRASLVSLTKVSKFKLSIVEVFKEHGFSKDKREQLRKTFDAMDKDKNGVLSLSEFKTSMVESGSMSAEAAERVFMVADINGDMKLSFEELLLTVADHQLRNVNERMCKMFLEMDENRDNYLSPDEIKNYFVKHLNDDPIIKELGLLNDIDSIVKEADVNGDGKISLEEFLEVIHPKDNDDDDEKKEVEFGAYDSVHDLAPFLAASKV